MSIGALRSAITSAGGTPTQYATVPLLRELVTALGGTPTQFTVIGLLREAIVAKGGTPTQVTEIGLLRELLVAASLTPPATFYVEDYWGALASITSTPAAPTNLINNGTMDSASGWTLTGTDPSISGGVGSCTTDGSFTRTIDNGTLVPGSWYGVTITVTGTVSVGITLGGTNTLASITAPGTFTVYGQAGAGGNTIAINITSAATIDNVIVSGPTTVTYGSNIVANGTFDDSSNWALGAGSITGGQLVFASASNARIVVNTPVTAPKIGSYYRVQADVSGYSAGNVNVFAPSFASLATSNGAKTAYLFATSTSGPTLRTQGTTTLNIDNLVVQEMTFS